MLQNRRWVDQRRSFQPWLRLTEALGAPELASDPRFETNATRMGHLATLVDVLSSYFATEPSDEWLTRLEQAGVPAGPVASIGEMLEHPQTLARDMVMEVDHTKLGPQRSLGSPVKMSSRGPAARAAGAPLLGEHTRDVLREVGYDAAEIDDLLEAGTARDPGASKN